MSKRNFVFAARPDLDVRLRMKPLHFEVASRGAVELALGEVRLRVDAIPVYLRVPFLKRRVLAASVGPFGVRLEPLEARIAAVEMDTGGVIGRDESGVDLHVTGAYLADIEATDESSDDPEESD